LHLIYGSPTFPERKFEAKLRHNRKFIALFQQKYSVAHALRWENVGRGQNGNSSARDHWRNDMKISEIMTRAVITARSGDTIQNIAQRMADRDVGCLPVTDGDTLVGIVTDRDIVMRAVASGKNSLCSVRDVMTAPAKSCLAEDSVESVVRWMGKQQVRRVPIVDAAGKLVGLVSLADAAKHSEAASTGSALEKIVRPGGEHNQRAFHPTTFAN
jgi:CBS domain-containing protein